MAVLHHKSTDKSPATVIVCPVQINIVQPFFNIDQQGDSPTQINIYPHKPMKVIYIVGKAADVNCTSPKRIVNSNSDITKMDECVNNKPVNVSKMPIWEHTMCKLYKGGSRLEFTRSPYIACKAQHWITETVGHCTANSACCGITRFGFPYSATLELARPTKT